VCEKENKMPKLRTSDWLDVTVEKDDASKLSAATDLGLPYRSVDVLVTNLATSATVTLHVAKTLDETYYPLYYISLNDGDDDAAITTAGTTAIAVIFPFFGFQYFKICLSAIQTSSDATFKVRGFN